MDEQRCSAPQILQNLSTPSAQRKDLMSHTSGKPPQTSASIKTDQPCQVSCNSAHYTAAGFIHTYPTPYNTFLSL